MIQENAARSLLLAETFGVLSTISLDVAGYPFGSVTPYCVDRNCQPVIYISPIAQHTRNISADRRVSLTVVESAGSDDVQAHGRVTYIGNAVEADSDRDAAERYFRHFPSSRQYDRTHAFTFFRLELVRVRYIGGFGQIFWVGPRDFALPNPFSAIEESRIIEHMNKDHADVLKRLIGAPCEMVGVDAEGFDVLRGDHKIRFPFVSPVTSVDEVRRAFVEMARRRA
jgi:putative heme iron utilization protein